VRFEVFNVVKIEFMLFWIIASCSVVVWYQHFGRQCCLHHQPWKWRQHGPPKCWYSTTTLFTQLRKP